jgi:hypothetical protein
LLDGIGRIIARYLQKPVHGYEPFTPSDPEALRQSLEPGDVLLVEGNNNISGVIEYLTQSTWSHSALYVGPVLGCVTEDGEPHVLVEANVGEGVVTAPLSKYVCFHTRICRPVGLTETDSRVCVPPRSSGSASPTISRISLISCAISFRCRCLSAGVGG